MKADKCTRICLWSGPRNISTAFMYSFAQRSDTVVYDEPLYAYYLSHSPAQEYHPGAEAVLASQPQQGQKVVDMMLGPQPKPVAFFKHMTHHLLDLDRGFMQHMKHILLTRDPMDMLPSFAKVIDQPKMQDVGYAAQLELLNYLKSIGQPPVVIDSKKLLLDPEKMLKKLCQFLEIPFEESMLSWEAGARPEDGVWAPYWYANVHKSTGFGQYQPKTEAFPEQLKPLLEEAQPYYEQLMKMSL